MVADETIVGDEEFPCDLPQSMSVGDWCNNAILDDSPEEKDRWILRSGRMVGITIDSRETRCVYFKTDCGEIWVGIWPKDRWENDQTAEAYYCVAQRMNRLLVGIDRKTPIAFEETDIHYLYEQAVRAGIPLDELMNPQRLTVEIVPVIDVSDFF